MNELLSSLKSKIKCKISELNYNTWFNQIEDVTISGDKFVILIPNKFVGDWINDFYRDLVSQTLKDITGKNLRVTYEISAAPEEAQPINREIFVPQSQAMRDQINSSGLISRLTFESFVVGSSNQFAHAACKAVADLPGGRYNPLFIYGGVGLGKTHLLNAIGIEVRKKYPDIAVLYLSGERFMNELITSIRFERMPEFRKKFRDKCHVLLIDDVQFIAGKERTQDEFFHTFNALHESQRQIVITSDRFPKEIRGLEERLRSRFEWGLIADIAPPDLETRIAILQKKAEADSLRCPGDVAMYLATNIKNNVRELEGSLIRLNAFASLTGAKITVDFAKEVLQNLIPFQNKVKITIGDIQRTVANFYSISVADLKSTCRTKVLAYPRQIAMYLTKKLLKTSFPEIGTNFGGKDHTTVMHACKKIERLLQSSEELKIDISKIEGSLEV
ncbi:MAG: chromosomal replication initiator protein DnaA [Pseudomonadota bacterium]